MSTILGQFSQPPHYNPSFLHKRRNLELDWVSNFLAGLITWWKLWKQIYFHFLTQNTNKYILMKYSLIIPSSSNKSKIYFLRILPASTSWSFMVVLPPLTLYLQLYNNLVSGPTKSLNQFEYNQWKNLHLSNSSNVLLQYYICMYYYTM